ncbi:MAG: transcription elongation factor GreA [Chthonomonas sp.]|nr:transcription elongation factor GreA [Chthonomonas sp.]
MANEILLSKAGYDMLSAELVRLKTVDRKIVAEAIREAKSHGDLRENAAYHEAKLNQTRLEGRIADLEKVVEYATIVDRPDSDGTTAHLGSRVKLKDLEWKDELEISLVGSFEADPANDLISITSPLGSAVLGKVAGDEVEVEAPAGRQRYQILDVS